MLALLGRSVAVVELPPGEDDWYANLLWLERRKCLLLTHAGTLFSVFLPDVRAAELRPLGPYLAAAMRAELQAEDLPADALGPLDSTDVQVARTASRSVLGFMNDMAVHVEYAVGSAGGLSACDPAAIGRQLRRTSYNRGGYLYPIDLAVVRVGERA
jgi:hypothetical protein